MGRITFPNILAKIGLAPHKSRLQAATAAAQSVLPQVIVMTLLTASLSATKSSELEDTPESDKPTHGSFLKRRFEFIHRYSLGIFALLVLIITVPSIQFGATYWTAHKIKPIVTSAAPRRHTVPLHGPNMSIPAGQLPATLEQITTQPINLVIGTRTVPVGADTIKSWLRIVTDKKEHISYIHLNENDIGPSLNQITSKFAKSPVNQVTTTYPDGTSAVIASGRNGTSVGDVGELAKQLAPSVLGAKGMQLNVPLQSVPFQSVTPAAFDKLIEVNVITKQMYLYDKGQFTRQYPISAGAPETPTPIGQFKVYQKVSLQDMKGFNPNGSKYLQPNVRWISYFLPGGYAVHGNYWRPSSWFGAINSSHGCVSLPEDQAKVVYDWTTIGTAVIVHT
jgi:lipoprotein-anchoring transpeptidase ErfK/SrfK